jgi:hypothetical protein
MKTIGLEAMRRHVEKLTAAIQTSPVRRLHQAKAIRDDDGEVLELWLPPVLIETHLLSLSFAS